MDTDIKQFQVLNNFILEEEDQDISEKYIENIFNYKLISQKTLIKYYKFSIGNYDHKSALYALSYIDKPLLRKLPMPYIATYALEKTEFLDILDILINNLNVIGMGYEDLKNIKHTIESPAYTKYKQMFDIINAELTIRSCDDVE